MKENMFKKALYTIETVYIMPCSILYRIYFPFSPEKKDLLNDFMTIDSECFLKRCSCKALVRVYSHFSKSF